MPCVAMEHTDSQTLPHQPYRHEEPRMMFPNLQYTFWQYLYTTLSLRWCLPCLRSGAISRDELAAVLLELDDSWTEESIDQLLCEADTSMDGELQVPQLPARSLFHLEFCPYSSPYHSEIMPVLWCACVINFWLLNVWSLCLARVNTRDVKVCLWLLKVHHGS